MKKISNFLFLAVIISCSQSGNSIDEILQEEARSINSNVETTTTVKNFYELDTLYRDGSDFKLPTFNANCTHAVSEIVKLFDFWNEEYNLNLSYDILGQPVLGSGSELQMEKCVEKIVGSNKDQNVSLKGNEHIELVVGKKYDITPFSEVSLSVQTILVSSFPNYGPISIALHPTNPDLDLISDINGKIYLLKNYEEIYSIDGVVVKDNGGLLSLKFLNDGKSLISFHTGDQKVLINLYEFNEQEYKIIKIKTLKEYIFPEYSKCNGTILLLEIYPHCLKTGEKSHYIGHAGGALQIHNNQIYIGLGDTNIPSGVFNSIYTTRDKRYPWGSILKFDYDSTNQEIIGSGNHINSNFDEIWIMGVRNPYRISINKESMWIADLGTSVQDEINYVSLNEKNIDLGWPYFEGSFPHEPLLSNNLDKKYYKRPILSERIGGLIGGHELTIDGLNVYIYGSMNGQLYGILIRDSGIEKVNIEYESEVFNEENFLISIEKTRSGIYLLTSNGKIISIEDT